MADNTSLVYNDFLLQQFRNQVVIVQILVMIFLSINFFLIVTFFKKEYFYTTARYILFALTLLSDSFLLFISDILLLFTHFNITFEVWICIIISFAVIMYAVVTPVTLTAMTLERYVAICMPLRHGELCTTRNTIHCILIIHGLSSVSFIAPLSTFFATASLSFYKQYEVCSTEIFFMFHLWQQHFRSALYQCQFLIMCIIIVFAYIKIMKVAKAASGVNEKSSKKGLRTVVLHGFQLLLCLIQLWTPLIEAAVLQIDFDLFINVRYADYVIFFLAPKCLSPLIYGLRDEAFFSAVKSHASCGLWEKK